MPAPAAKPTPPLDFHALAAKALTCSEQWELWAKHHGHEEEQAKRARDLAALFTQQAVILTAMHRNRTEWTTPARSDFTRRIP